MRRRDFIPVDIIFMSSRRPCYSDCRVHRVFAVNISVGVMTRQDQNLTADGEGVTVGLIPSPPDGGDSDVAQAGDSSELAGVSCCRCSGGELKLRVVGWSSAWPEGDDDSYIFNGCLGVLTQLLVTAHPTCHGTGPTGPATGPPSHTSII